MKNNYELIVGMEIHVELRTKSKMFCGCRNNPFHAEKPNIHTCPVCLGMPGGLPVANRQAIDWTILLGLALDCEIAEFSKFDRKNYFYPDLAKGYQISQYDQPFCRHGLVKTELGDVRIHRVHLEEDTGKLMHKTIDGRKCTLVDFNRSGVPLVEIVTEPDIRNGDQAKVFLKKLHQIIRYLAISDADMEKGSMRLEPNISVRKLTAGTRPPDGFTPIRPEDLPKYKVEVKNINSFNYVKKAIDYEFTRQVQILEKGEIPVQETRGWNEDKNLTFSQRRKETADDYRYFPEPDIPPLIFSQEHIANIRKQLPELPEVKTVRYTDKLKLQPSDAALIAEDQALAGTFEEVLALSRTEKQPLDAAQLAKLIVNRKIEVTGKNASQILTAAIAKTQVRTMDADLLKKIISAVIAENPGVVKDYKSGKETAIMYLVGQVMRKSSGKGNAQEIISILKSSLS